MKALAAAVVVLGRELRAAGIGVVPSDEVDAAQALALLPRADREEARRALRIAFKVRRKHWDAFDAVFDRLWSEAEVPQAALERGARVPAASSTTAHRDRERPLSLARGGRLSAPVLADASSHGLRPHSLGGSAPEPPPAARGRGESTDPSADLPPPAQRGEGRGEGQGPGEGEGEDPGADLPGYSPEALLRKKPFEACSPEDLTAMERLLERLGRRLATRRSRRLAPTRGRGVPDLRRSLRRALATDGDLVALARRARRIEEPRLVVLCDTSGSMDAHARFLLAFALALRRAAPSTEVFAFNTSLVRLTPLLAPGRVGAALERFAAEVPDWSGGTRIGESLDAFVEGHLHERVDARTVVVILSDGLDRGDVSKLAAAMRAIQARARRVIWLNPLLGDPRYRPSARGMEAALPFVDRFLPAHDLASLEALLPHLSQT